MLSRGYTTFVALLCTAAVAYAIHANGEAAKAGRAAARAQKWERYARATRAHRRQTAKSFAGARAPYNKLARNATAEQRRLLATLRRGAAATSARGRAARRPSPTATQSIAIASPPGTRRERTALRVRRPQHRPSPRRRRAEDPMADLSRHRGIASALLAAGAVGGGVIGGASVIVKARGAGTPAASAGATALHGSRPRRPRAGDGPRPSTSWSRASGSGAPRSSRSA